MKRIVMGVAALLVAAGGLVGCRVPLKTDEDMFGYFQKRAKAIQAHKGIAVIGIGKSRELTLALDQARTRGRVELAQALEVKVDSMKKDFQEEVGEASSSEINALFAAAAKVITHRIMSGSVPDEEKYLEEGEQGKGGRKQVTAYTLMTLNPKIVADALGDQANTQRALYTRFRSSRAFAELEDEVRKYEEFKKSEGMIR